MTSMLSERYLSVLLLRQQIAMFDDEAGLADGTLSVLSSLAQSHPTTQYRMHEAWLDRGYMNWLVLVHYLTFIKIFKYVICLKF